MTTHEKPDPCTARWLVAVAAVLLVALGSGCSSSRVAMTPTDRAMTRDKAVKLVNSSLDWNKVFLVWSSQNPNANFRDLGAYNGYVGVMHITSSHTTPSYAGGYYVRQTAEIAKIRYAEIKDVIVVTELLGLMCCGIIDPTVESFVQIVTVDGTRYSLPVGRSWGLFPFYLGGFSRQNAQKAAGALCWLRDANASQPLIP